MAEKKKKTAEELERLRRCAEGNIRDRLETYSPDEHPERVHAAELFNLAGVTIPDYLWVGKYEKLSLEAKVLYSFIRRRAFQSREAHFTEDGFVFVKMSQSEMMQITSKRTPNTVRRITDELEAVGLIDIEKQEDMCSVRKIFLHHIFREDGTPLLEMDKDDTKKAREKHRDYQRRTKKEVMKEVKTKAKKKREVWKAKEENPKEFALRLYPEFLKRLQAAGVDISLYHIATQGNTEELYKVFEEAGVCCSVTGGTREFYEDHADVFKVGGWHEDIDIDWSLIKAVAEREGKEGEERALNNAVKSAALLLTGWEDEAAEWHEEHKSKREKKEEERQERDRQKAEARAAKAAETRRRNRELKEKEEAKRWNRSEDAGLSEFEAYKRELAEEEWIRQQDEAAGEISEREYFDPILAEENGELRSGDWVEPAREILGRSEIIPERQYMDDDEEAAYWDFLASEEED